MRVPSETALVKGNTHTTPKVDALEMSRHSTVAGPDLDPLDAPLEYLLASGGDRRLHLDPIRMLNGYGCRPWPRPEAFTFASSTASSISERGFAAAAAARQQLIECCGQKGLEEACDLHAERLRDQIKTLLELSRSGAEIIFSTSGTDSQLHALYVAQTVLGGSLASVVVASDETGRGTADATIGCHFSSSTARGEPVLQGARIIGFAEDTTSIAIPLREKDGGLRSNSVIDREVCAAVARSIASGKRVVLHVMDSSKFGRRCPSLDCLRQIQADWGRSVQVVVDACQLRLGRERLKYYLAEGFIVLISGSKFFTGPPFSGALLVPADASAVMRRIDAVPAGLSLYANRNDWPICWSGVRSKLPARPNVGQLLRWVAAVEELRAFFAVPASYRSLALRLFSRVVARLIAARPNLELLPEYHGSGADGLDDEEMAARTIFPFSVRRHGKLLSVEACSRIYRALNRDVSNLLSRSATAAEFRVAARSCHIGQPAGVLDPVEGIAGTLRISAGARLVSETWRAAGEAESLRELDQEFDQIRTILDKIDLLLENFDALDDVAETQDMAVMCEADFVRLPSRARAVAGAAPGAVLLCRPSEPVDRTVGPPFGPRHPAGVGN
jgi:hypothetical protein